MNIPRKTGERERERESICHIKSHNALKITPAAASIGLKQRRVWESQMGINLCGIGSVEMNDIAIMNELTICTKNPPSLT